MSLHQFHLSQNRNIPDTGHYRIAEFYRIPDTGIQIRYIRNDYIFWNKAVIILLYTKCQLTAKNVIRKQTNKKHINLRFLLDKFNFRDTNSWDRTARLAYTEASIYSTKIKVEICSHLTKLAHLGIPSGPGDFPEFKLKL